MKFKAIIRVAGIAFLLSAIAAAAGTPALIPLPQSMQLRPGVFTLCATQPAPAMPGPATMTIQTDAASQETAQYLATMLLKSTGYQFQIVTNAGTSPVKNAILLTTANSNVNLGTEGYELTVAPDSVVIRAPASAGVFYGVQTLLQLLPPQIFAQRPVSGMSWTAPCVEIQDQPRFQWRGWMLDVVRHFFSKQEIKQLLDAMALHKLNMFHMHLVDDEGWRIQILKYPLLTQVGSWRNAIDWGLNPRASTEYNASGQYGGFYSQDDIREIVAYAKQRHITVVPEIEMPGHSTAGLASYPQYGCTNTGFNMDNTSGNASIDIYSPGTTGTFQFLQDILTEVMGLFPSQYIHIGGDEVSSTLWNTTPADETQMRTVGITPGASGATTAYQSWFEQQMANWIQSQGRSMMGWSEIFNGGILTNASLMDWKGGGEAAAAAGRYVVMTPTSNCYFDYYQYTGVTWDLEPLAIGGNLPLSTVYGLEPIPTNLPPADDSFVLGAQGNQWCEYVPSLENIEFKTYPRLCAISEVTWSPAALKNYTDFTQRLVVHEARLAQAGINYDNHSVVTLGSWTSSQISKSAYATLQWNVTSSITNAGEVDVSFYNTSGTNGLNVAWTSLQVNGAEIDRDTHAGTTGSSASSSVYVLHLPALKPGATYTVSASVEGNGGTSTSGNVLLTNWD